MGFFKEAYRKSVSFKNWALSVSEVYVQLDEIENELSYNSGNYNDINSKLREIAYFTKREIIDKMDDFDSTPTTKVALKNLPYQRVTVLFAYQKTVGRLILLSESSYISGEINQILEM